MRGRYPVNGRVFHIWGETFTKVGLRRSPIVGPVSHIRICDAFVFISSTERGQYDEETLAYYDQDTRKWVINHREADTDGYYELMFSTEDPPTPNTTEHGYQTTTKN